MNCFIGTGNGSVENVIIDDENTNVVKISLCVNSAPYYEFQLITNTRDFVLLSTQYYTFTRLFFPDGSVKANTDGWLNYEVIKHPSMVQFKFNFYTVMVLGHWMGGIAVLDSNSARRIFGRFFPGCSLGEATYDATTKVWTSRAIQITSLYANVAFNLGAIKKLQSEMTETEKKLGEVTLLLALLSEQVANIEKSYISTQEALKNLQFFVQKITFACAAGGTFNEYDPTILIDPKPPKKQDLLQQIYNIQIGLTQLKNSLSEEQTVVFKKQCTKQSNIFKF